jgi:hypothetical protein
MAEAHSATSTTLSLRSTAQRSFFVTEEGVTFRCTCSLPTPLLCARRTSRWCTRAQHDLSYALYPFSYLTVPVGVAAVLASPPASWLRSGGAATLAWRWGSQLPLFPLLPTPVRVAALAAVASLCLLGLLSLLQRHLLSALLRYKGWLAAARKPSLLTRAWGGAVWLLSRGTPMTLSFQGALPRQPVPPLRATVDKFLESARLLQSPEQLALTRAQAAEFLAGPGPRLQALLTAKSFLWSHPTTDWWERYVYLKGRSTLAVNSNYYALDAGNWRPTTLPCARAAVLLHNIGLFNDRLNNDELPPIRLQGLVPLCMAQYERVFATARLPGRDIDTLRHWDPSTVRHVAVQCRGSHYFLNLYSPAGVLRSPRELQGALEALARAAQAAAPRPAEAALCSLTALPRTRWAEVRSEFFSEGQNRRSLEKVESALLWMNLEVGGSGAPAPPSTWTQRARALLHGDPARPTVWFDKSLSLNFFSNGHMGVNAEHSWADAPVVAHLMEEILIGGEQGSPGIVDSTGLPGSTPNPEAVRYYDEAGNAAELPASAAAAAAAAGAGAGGGQGRCWPCARL